MQLHFVVSAQSASDNEIEIIAPWVNYVPLFIFYNVCIGVWGSCRLLTTEERFSLIVNAFLKIAFRTEKRYGIRQRSPCACRQ